MNRNQVLNKIRAMLALQQSTDFEGEAENAKNLIEKLCKEYGVDLNTINKPEILDEVFETFNKFNEAKGQLLNAVANFYDAVAYISRKDGKALKIIGSEAQIIQTQLYFEYLYDVMEREADKAFMGEKVLAELIGRTPPSKAFKNNFRLAFVKNVSERLNEMKEGKHEHAEFVKQALSTMRFGKARKGKSGSGDGAYAGSSAGSTVSLNKQASGSHQKFLVNAASL